MSAGSFTVQTCTCLPARWAASRKRPPTTRIGPDRSGTWKASAAPTTGRPTRAAQRGDDLPRPRRSGHPTTARMAEAGEPPVMERRHQHSLFGFEAGKFGGQQTLDARLLEVEVEQAAGEGGQHLLEQRDAHPGAPQRVSALGGEVVGGIERAQFLPVAVPDQAAPVGEAVEAVVVEDDHPPIAGGVYVGLQVAESQVNGPLKGDHGVLRPQHVAAPVAEAQGVLLGEERPHRHQRREPGRPGPYSAFDQ